MSDWKPPDWLENTPEPATPRRPSEVRPAPRAARPHAPRAPEPTLPPAMESALTDHILGKEPEPEPEPGTPEAENPELAPLRRISQALAKAVKGVQLYPPENPMCVRFADDLFAGFAEHFRSADTVRYAVGKSRLYVGGEPVLEQEGRDDSVPGRLFWDGIREISFHAGLTRDEMLTFLTLFRRAPVGEEGREDDLVTLLWESRFDHITYIAVNDILDLENESDPVPPEFGQEFMNYVDLEMHNLEDEEETERLASEMAESIKAKILKEDDPELFGITPPEREALRAEIREEDSPKMLDGIVNIILETLNLERDEESFVTLVQILSGTMLGLLGEGRLAEGAGILRMMQDLAGRRTDLAPPMRAVIEAGIHAAWDDTRREALGRLLQEGRAGSLEGLTAYVDVLPAGAAGPLCGLLPSLENPKVRRRLMDALVAKAAGDISSFLPFLRDSRPEMVRTVVEILGALKNEGAVKPLTALIRHSDFRVRREVLAALAQLGRGRALDALQGALLDPDPRMRMAAARGLASTGRRAVPVLLAVIDHPGFDQRELVEKRTFYEALGFAGKAEVLPLVQQALHRKGLLRRGNVEEIRACACEALGWIGSLEAKALLGEVLNDKSVLVRTAAQSALRRIVSQTNQEFTVKEAA